MMMCSVLLKLKDQGHPGGGRMLQHFRRFRLPAEDLRPGHAVLQRLPDQYARNHRQPGLCPEFVRDERDQVQLWTAVISGFFRILRTL